MTDQTISLKPVDRVEITTLVDNYVDVLLPSSDVVTRPSLDRDGQISTDTLIAEHGLSLLVTVYGEKDRHTILLDTGHTKIGVPHNMERLGIDVTDIEAIVMSHRHMDHTGGLQELRERIGKKEIELVSHPGVFRYPRYIKIDDEMRISFPAFDRDNLRPLGINPTDSTEPLLTLGGGALFLGEIPRRTSFEKGMANCYHIVAGKEEPDAIEDDSGVVLNLRDKGLVILTGCAHAGIINTVDYAREITGTAGVHAIMGGFHLSGPNADLLIDQTIASLIEIDPDYIIPTHCTGRTAIQRIEEAMPEKFLLNMSGTTITFE